MSLFDLLEDYYPENDETRTEATFFPPNHNTAPLTLYPHKTIVQCINNQDTELYKVLPIKKGVDLVTHCAKIFPGYELTVDSGPVYAHILRSSTTTRKLSRSKRKRGDIEVLSPDMCWRAALGCVRTELEGLETHHHLDIGMTKFVQHLETTPTILERLKNVLILRNELECHKQDVQNLVVERSDAIIESAFCGLRIMSNKQMSIITVVNDRHLYLLSYDQMVMLGDVVISRSCSMMACLINDETDQNLLPSFETLLKVYNWGDQLMTTFGLKSYEVIGEFESLCTRSMLNYNGGDRLGLSDSYEDAIRENAAEIKETHGIPDTWVDEIFTLLGGLPNINQLSEIFGLRKHWGNPILDAQLSGRKVQEKANEDYPIEDSAVMKTYASFQRMLTLQYIQREKRWPACRFAPGYEDTPIAKQHKNRSNRVLESDPAHRREHWEGLIFERNKVIDGSVTPLDLLTDKSCSLYRSHLDFLFVHAMRKDANKQVKVPEQRRILLEYMRINQPSLEEIFEVIEKDQIPHDWLANSCSLKGTEMKNIAGRIFAVLPYPLRQYFSATEEIIKRFIFPYNPYQTMTMKEPELLRLLDKITSQLNPESDSRMLYVLHIIDFSKWNLRMCNENTRKIFESMDRFLGRENLISATHDIFFRLKNVVQDAFNPPPDGVENTTSDTIWTGHKRGWEGQRQKGWTALTSALLAAIFEDTGIFSQIIGQGDNQVLCSEFPIPEKYKNAAEWIEHEGDIVTEQLQAFYDHLVKSCEEMGLPVKKSESCRSLTFCNYGKRLYHRGVELSMELKRISRIATESNESFPTTENLCKTMTGSSAAAPLYGPPSLTSLIVGHYNVAATIMRGVDNNPLAGRAVRVQLMLRGVTVNHHMLRRIMMIPGSLNGPHRTTPLNSFYRGHPDPLAADFATICLSARNGSTFHLQLLTGILAGKFKNQYSLEEDTVEGLIRSPYSLNVHTTQSPTGPLFSQVEDALAIYCKNDEVSPLFSDECSSSGDRLLAVLSTMKPFHPTVANEIFMRSLRGRRETFLAGFKHTTSFARLLSGVDIDYLKNIRRLEVKMLLGWFGLEQEVLNITYNKDMNIPPHWIALQYYRELTWGRQIEGVTIPHPSEFCVMVQLPSGVCTKDCASYMDEKVSMVLLDDDRVSAGTKEGHTRFLERVPGRKGYTGNVIEEAMAGKTLRVINCSTAVEDAVRLNTLRRWVAVPDSPLDKLITEIIASRTNMEICQLNEMSGTPIRLSYTHRAHLMSSQKRSSAASMTNFHTQVYISSNDMGKFSSSSVNYALPYGPLFLFSQHLIGISEFLTNSRDQNEKKVYHCHVYLDCIPKVYDGPVDVSSFNIRMCIPQRKTCKLLFANSKDLVIEVIGSPHKEFTYTDPTSVPIHLARRAYGIQALGDLFIREEKMRELIGVAGIVVSNPRDISISVGDISGIGVRSFISSIANALLLYIPWETSIALAQGRGDKMLKALLEGVGYKSWKNIANPFLTPRLIRRLQRQIPSIKAPTTGVIVDPTIEILQLLVHKEIKVQLAEITARLTKRSRFSTLLIMIDGADALKFLVSRYVEICLAILCGLEDQSSSSKYMDRNYATQESSRRIHRLPTDDFSHFMEQANVVFQSVQRCYRAIEVPLPNPIIMNLNLNWAGAVRNNEPRSSEGNPAQHGMADGVVVSLNTLDPKRYLRLTIPEVWITTRTVDCNCLNFVPCCQLELERLGTPSGSTGKAHYPICEIVSSFKLDVTGVLSFGYKSGLELAVIAQLAGNQFLYFNPLKRVSDFALHCAGSYIPVEFLINRHKSKLIDTASTVLSHVGGEFLLDAAPVLAQVKDYDWSGVIYKVQSLLEEDLPLLVKSLINVMKVAGLLVSEGGWMILEIQWVCQHILATVISIMGATFTDVRIVETSFRTYPNGSLFLVGCRPVLGVTSKIAQIYGTNFTVLAPQDITNIGLYLDRLSALSLPKVVRTVGGSRGPLKAIDEIIESGVEMARDLYLPGWFYDLSNTSLSDCITSLEHYIQECHFVGGRIVTDTHRFFSRRSMTTGSKFIVNKRSIRDQINDVGSENIRASILIRVLKECPSGTADEILDLIERSLMMVYGFASGNRPISISYKYSEFMEYHLGNLLELVAFFLKSSLRKSSLKSVVANLHFIEKRLSDHSGSALAPMSLSPLTTIESDHRWKWPKLSNALMICLAASYRNYMNIFVLGFLDSSLRSLVNSLDKVTALLAPPDIAYDDGNLFIVVDEHTLQAYIDSGLLELGDVFCHMKREAGQKFLSKGLVKHVTRPVFCGTTPDTCWILLSQKGGYAEAASLDVQWNSTTMLWPAMNADTNCRCRDCCGLAEIVEMTPEIPSFAWLYGRFLAGPIYESVFDQSH